MAGSGGVCVRIRVAGVGAVAYNSRRFRERHRVRLEGIGLKPAPSNRTPKDDRLRGSLLSGRVSVVSILRTRPTLPGPRAPFHGFLTRFHRESDGNSADHPQRGEAHRPALHPPGEGGRTLGGARARKGMISLVTPRSTSGPPTFQVPPPDYGSGGLGSGPREGPGGARAWKGCQVTPPRTTSWAGLDRRERLTLDQEVSAPMATLTRS